MRPARRLRLRGTVLDVSPDAPLIMGVLNASPESFSDGAEAATVERRLARAGELVDQGADLVDVGGESGVTSRAPIPPDEELRRILPLVTELVAAGAIVSVDTWKAPVALAALEAGAHLVNDVSGLADPAIAALCARFGAGLVVMHTRARPKAKEFPPYDDVVDDVRRFLAGRMDEAVGRGLDPESVVLDPGPDFAKTPAQTVAVLSRLGALSALDRPLLLAVSRKDFVGALTGRPPRDRLAGTLAAVGEGTDAGAGIVRVHDVAATRDFLAVRAALRGATPVDPGLRLPEALRREAPGAPEGGPTGAPGA
ncbi:MAG TPA: dihydropteroate synthase, partial [Acidimicrobiales bacterium]|nr:dihydropteroate synthase [Acidimicrobiales bacterium]